MTPLVYANLPQLLLHKWAGRVVRWCCVNFQYCGVLLIWTIVGQGPVVSAVDAGRVLGLFGLFVSSIIFPLSHRLWETA